MSLPRTIIITGASAGVGRAIALRFASAGDSIGLIARDREALEEVARQIRSLGAKAAVESVDVADPEKLFAASTRLQAELGPVDVWINDAMETVFSPLVDMNPDEFRRVTEVTYLGFVYGVMAALKAMRPRKSGVIIQIGSALAYRGIPLQSAYCGAKHAIRGFTDSVRAELIHEGSPIKMIMVQLPAVNTPQFDWARTHLPRTPRPLGRLIEPDVAAEAVYRASRGGWREYWVGYPTFATILGNAIAPGLMDRFLAFTAIEGQQTKTPALAGRADNLNAPVAALHRTRGSFGEKARAEAPVAPGELVRFGAAAAGALAFFILGANWNKNRTPPRIVQRSSPPPAPRPRQAG